MLLSGVAVLLTALVGLSSDLAALLSGPSRRRVIAAYFQAIAGIQCRGKSLDWGGASARVREGVGLVIGVCQPKDEPNIRRFAVWSRVCGQSHELMAETRLIGVQSVRERVSIQGTRAATNPPSPRIIRIHPTPHNDTGS